MKYVLKEIWKSGGLSMLLISMILSTIANIIMARYLFLLSKILVTSGNEIFTELMILTIVSIIIESIRPYFYTRSKMTIWCKLTNNFIEKVSISDYDFFIKFSAGELGHVEKSIHDISKFFILSGDIFMNTVTFITNLVSILIIAPISSFIIIPIYVIGIIIIKIATKKWNDIDKELDNVKNERSKLLEDSICGFYERMIFTQEKIFQNKLMHMMKKSQNLILRRTYVDMGINSSFSIVDSAVTVGLLILTISLVSKGHITGEIGLSIIMYGWRMLNPVSNVIDGIGEISTLLATVPRYVRVLTYQNRDTSKEIIKLDKFNDKIIFDNVSFSYEKSDMILNKLNLTIEKGQHIGICGPSGEGKSTLMKLINKLHTVDDGNITIDGINYNSIITSSLRSKMGGVPQDPYLFNCNIYENIQIVKPEALESEIIDACKKASIYDFIKSLPEGFKTNVGPRGLKLSGGQKQRIALARLFLADPDIILLDEATSALDNESETVIQESLNLFQDKTIIAVAHRLSTIQNCDKIIVIKNHGVVEEGTHDELVKKKGVYYNMLPTNEQ